MIATLVALGPLVGEKLEIAGGLGLGVGLGVGLGLGLGVGLGVGLGLGSGDETVFLIVAVADVLESDPCEVTARIENTY